MFNQQYKYAVHPNLHQGNPVDEVMDETERQKLTAEIKKDINDGKLFTEDVLMDGDIPGDVVVSVCLSEENGVNDRVLEMYTLKVCAYLKTKRPQYSWDIRNVLDAIEDYLSDKTTEKLQSYLHEKRKFAAPPDNKYVMGELFDYLMVARTITTLVLTIECNNHEMYARHHDQDEMSDKDLDSWMHMGRREVVNTLAQYLREAFTASMC